MFIFFHIFYFLVVGILGVGGFSPEQFFDYFYHAISLKKLAYSESIDLASP